MCVNFELWKKALIDPNKIFKKQIKKASIKEGIAHVGTAGIIGGLIFGVAMMMVMVAAGTLVGSVMSGISMGLSILLMSVVITPICLVVCWLLESLTLYIYSVILGGKGKFSEQSYLMALVTSPIAVIMSLVMMIPFVGSIVALLVFLYALYPMTIVLKQSHKFNTQKALAVWVLPTIMILLAIFLMGVSGASFVESLNSLQSQGLLS